jgi:N-methylhydantoinase B
VARTAFSSLLRDAHDCTCMFTDRRGRELAQGTFATPGQSGAMALGIKRLVNALPADSYDPGDVFITNDPWALAGHLNDVCVWSPIFHHRKLQAFTACVFHHSDIGDRVSSDNHDVHEDGLFIPLVKLYRAGTLNETVLDMIRWNVRTPDEVVGGIRSQIAANHVCAEKIRQMLDEHRRQSLDGLADEIIDRTERSIRKAIGAIPDGVYRAEGIVEQMEGRPDVAIKAAVEVKGSDITVDLAGSSPHVGWGDSALAQAMPDRVLAGSGGTPATMNVFYGRGRDDRPWHSVIIRGGGMGAAARRDYGVLIHPATTEVDRGATGGLRRRAPRA